MHGVQSSCQWKWTVPKVHMQYLMKKLRLLVAVTEPWQGFSFGKHIPYAVWCCVIFLIQLSQRINLQGWKLTIRKILIFHGLFGGGGGTDRWRPPLPSHTYTHAHTRTRTHKHIQGHPPPNTHMYAHTHMRMKTHPYTHTYRSCDIIHYDSSCSPSVVHGS